MERIHCPLHSEQTPSLVIYDTHAYCYGGCGRIELSALGREAPEQPKERFRENLEETRKYVETLPKKRIRGFDLPYDDRGYYLLFPDSLYYKRRSWTDEGPKYKNPAGHSQPVYVVRDFNYGRLFLVEGEINAMSVGRAFPYESVMSPGSASDFKAEKTRPFLTSLRSYSTIVLVVDRDGPGTEAAIHAKGLLLGKTPSVQIVLMSRDANEILCEEGEDALRSAIDTELRRGL